jgi:hypothetical protein
MIRTKKQPDDFAVKTFKTSIIDWETAGREQFYRSTAWKEADEFSEECACAIPLEAIANLQGCNKEKSWT